MIARIVDNHWIYMDQITVPEEDVIYKAFSIQHPNAQYIDTMFGMFDGWIRKYNKKRQRIARPLLKELVEVCRRNNIPISVVDERESPKYPAPDPSVVTPDLLPGITLEEYQIRAIRASCRAEVGLISSVTGSGKTEIMAGICKIMDCPTVILGDMKVIVDQIRERLELRDIDEIGVFYAGKRPSGQKVIVGSIQSLTVPRKPQKTRDDTPESYARKLKAYKTRRKNAQNLIDHIRKCELLLVDEADKATNKQWRKLFMEIYRGRRKYGLSGTFFDPDKPVEAITLKEHLGAIIAETSREEVQSKGRIVPIEYIALGFGDPKYIKDKSAFDIAEKEWLTDNREYHNIINKLCELEIRKDDKVGILVLVEKKDLGYTLESIIPNSRFICGDHSMKQRHAAIKAFEEREINVLIGGKIVERGLDLDGGCEVLIIATGGRSAAKFNQKVGRAVRRNRKGKSKVYDFFFLCNHYLYAHSRNRLKEIVSMGYPSKVVFKEGTVEANKFIRSRFRRPK